VLKILTVKTSSSCSESRQLLVRTPETKVPYVYMYQGTVRCGHLPLYFLLREVVEMLRRVQIRQTLIGRDTANNSPILRDH
jgi:hypothetical protein